MYNWMGKAALRYGFRYARRRYRREAGVALGLLVGVLSAAIAYFLTREVPEG
ncbi:MAG TPA: hypothetical protein VD761_11695 [Solirubrobacterales bacterium]|nr:hypothetical protein [Solirubrobacterales bacterium]